MSLKISVITAMYNNEDTEYRVIYSKATDSRLHFIQRDKQINVTSGKLIDI